MREHAILSASGAHRWLSCPPSAKLEEKFPDQTSESAIEGTFAHTWGEIQLRHFLTIERGEVDEHFQQSLKDLKQNAFYNPALEDYVEEYISIVTGKYLDSRKRDHEAALMLEQHLDFSDWVPQGFGRGDAVIIADGKMEVIDLKYGKNVRVLAEGNPQLRLYALGAYAELSCIYDIDSVTVTIVQPRNGGESSESLTIDELLAWGESIRPVAEMAIKGNGEFNPGEHCRFCRARNCCKTLAEHNLAVARYEFKNPDLLDDEEVSDILQRVDDLVKWANGVKEYALAEAVDRGYRWPGFKLVEGRSNRKITDEKKAVTLLQAQGYAADKIYKPKEIQNLTNLEKLVGKKNLAGILMDIIIKPPGKPTLVPLNDPREEFNAAKDDFEAISF